MIAGFENLTGELSEKEIEIAEWVARGLNKKLGKTHAVSNRHIRTVLKNKQNTTISSVRLRKIIHELRTKHIVKRLIACKKGYYIATESIEVRFYKKSLLQRLSSIKEIIIALDKQESLICQPALL